MSFEQCTISNRTGRVCEKMQRLSCYPSLLLQNVATIEIVCEYLPSFYVIVGYAVVWVSDLYSQVVQASQKTTAGYDHFASKTEKA